MAASDRDESFGKEHSAEAEPAIANVDGVGSVAKSVGDELLRAPEDKASAEEQPSVPFIRLFSFADKYDYALMFWGSIGAAVHGAALPVFFKFFGNLLNGLGNTAPGESQLKGVHTVNKNALNFVILGVVCLVSSWLEVAFWMQTGERQAAKLRAKYLQSLLRQDVGYFDTDTSTGDFVSSISSDPILVQDAISEKVGNFIHYMATFVAGFVVGFTNQWRIALVTIAVVPIIAMSGGLYAYTLTGATAKASSAYTEAGNVSTEAVAQVRTVYSFVGESRVFKAYSNALQKTSKFGAMAGLAKGAGMGITYGALFCCWALLFWYGGVLIRSGKTDGGQAMAGIFAVIIGGMSLGQALPNITAFSKGKVAAFKIFQMLDREPIINNRDMTADTLESVQGLIELRNVDFSYPSRPDVPIFKNFSLVIPPGKAVAIVGSSGSGKSTVVSLIERFYDPTGGQILLDGHDLRNLDLKWLRGQIGLVSQEPALFATSIAANILYGKDSATQSEIEEAAKAANAHSFISQLPLRYETQVGERGVQLSGGQKQRVAIARAMVKNPAVLLLDEATSALDSGSEQVVQEALDRLMVGRTTVVVAHRLTTIRNADSIAVVQEGKIVESGTHPELISREDGVYSTLVRLQELAATKEGSLKESMSRNSFTPGRQSSVGRVASFEGSRFSLSRDGSTKSADRGEAKIANNEKDSDEIDKVPIETRKGSIIRLLAISKDDWMYGVAGTLGSIFAGCLNPAFALVVSSVLSAYYSNDKKHMKSEVAKYALIFLALGILSPFIYVLQHYPLAVVGEKLVKRVREKMFATILRNELGWFDRDENNSSQVAARLSSDATHVRGAVGDRISVILQNTTLLVVSATIGFIVQWKMAFVLMATFPLLVLSAVAENLFLKGFSGDLAKAHARASQVAGEAVANIRTVAAFNAEDKVQGLFLKELEGPVKKSFWRGQVAGFGFGISQFFLYAGYALGLWYAGKLVSAGQSTFGKVLKVFFVSIITAFATAETLALAPDLAKGGQAVKSVFEVLDRNTDIEPDDPEGKIVDKIKGEIRLQNVVFAYPSRPDVIIFKGLNLKVRSSCSLALVGPSGSGKSSVIAVIERFYDPMSGSILIDGIDLKKYNLKSIRQHIALVQQEPALFATSIYENIRFGNDRASEAEVIEAAKVANAHQFISALPDGYKTEVGERGIQLSGGQKQRVAIARAVLKDPAILLLDEATSALDAESEKIVQKALDRLSTGRTTVIVAHRLSTIRGADSIAVVQDGTIVEEGSHSDLLSKGGAYASLVNLQNRTHQFEAAGIDTD